MPDVRGLRRAGRESVSGAHGGSRERQDARELRGHFKPREAAFTPANTSEIDKAKAELEKLFIAGSGCRCRERIQRRAPSRTLIRLSSQMPVTEGACLSFLHAGAANRNRHKRHGSKMSFMEFFWVILTLTGVAGKKLHNSGEAEPSQRHLLRGLNGQQASSAGMRCGAEAACNSVTSTVSIRKNRPQKRGCYNDEGGHIRNGFSIAGASTASIAAAAGCLPSAAGKTLRDGKRRQAAGRIGNER